jgi:hypothetical protein
MGSRDPDFKQPAEEARWVAGQLGGEVVMVEGAGHYPHTEMSAFTGKKVIEFLGSRVGEDAHARAGYA